MHNWLLKMLEEVHTLEQIQQANIVTYKHCWLENHQLTQFGELLEGSFDLKKKGEKQKHKSTKPKINKAEEKNKQKQKSEKTKTKNEKQKQLKNKIKKTVQ